MQQGPDGRIYIARAFSFQGFGEMSVIYNPDRPGNECNLDMLNGSFQDFNLGGKINSWGTPNFMQSYFDLPHFNVDSVCYFDSTMFVLRNEANINSVEWNFGDPESGSLNTSTQLRPFHRFTEPGIYQVTVTETYNGQDYTYTESVTVNEPPDPQLPDTVFMYQGSTVRLDAGQGFTSYSWITGETSEAITVSEPGTYWVVVENSKCCFNLDSVVVILFDIIVPNAFRPGGVNSEFKAKPTAGVELNDYKMYIYNRWGQLIFEADNPEEGWDGTVNGDEAPGEVYVWVINYFVERDGGEERVTRKGNLILLR
jgi:gliding motility-associated-like protein